MFECDKCGATFDDGIGADHHVCAETSAAPPPFLTAADIDALNAARVVLDTVEKRAVAYAPDLPQHAYTSRGRLAEAADIAEHCLFNLLNLANASGLVPLTYPQLHNRPDPADAEAEERA